MKHFGMASVLFTFCALTIGCGISIDELEKKAGDKKGGTLKEGEPNFDSLASVFLAPEQQNQPQSHGGLGNLVLSGFCYREGTTFDENRPVRLQINADGKFSLKVSDVERNETFDRDMGETIQGRYVYDPSSRVMNMAGERMFEGSCQVKRLETIPVLDCESNDDIIINCTQFTVFSEAFASHASSSVPLPFPVPAPVPVPFPMPFPTAEPDSTLSAPDGSSAS